MEQDRNIMDMLSKMIPALKQVEGYLSPLEYSDDEKKRIGDTFRFILGATMALLILLTPILVLIVNHKLPVALVLSFSIGVCFIVLQISHRDRLHQAIIGYLTYMWLATAAAVFFGGGSVANGGIIFFPTMMMIALFLGQRASVITTIVTLLYMLGLMLINEFGTPLEQYFVLKNPVSWIVFLLSAVLTLIPLLSMYGELRLALKKAEEQIEERKNTEKSLRESEARYRLISSVTSDYTFSARFNDDGKLEYTLLTGAFEAITGYTPEEYKEVGWVATVHPDDREQDARDNATLRSNKPIDSLIRIIRKDGEVRWTRINAYPVWDEEKDQFIGIDGGVRDVTESEEAENAILELNSELTRKANQLTTINEIARDISAITDLTSTLKRIKDKLETMLPLDVFYVALHEEETDTISFPIMYDMGKYWEEERGNVTVVSGGVGQVLRTGEPLLTNRTPEEIAVRHKDSSNKLGDYSQISASIIFAPLIVGEKSIGVISVQSYTLNSYDEAHVDLLLGAGYQIAIAVENARLYDSLKESEERYRLISSVTSDFSFSTYVNEEGGWAHALLSGAFEAITGYTQHEYEAMGGWLAILHPDDKERDTRDMAQLRNNRQVETQVRIIRKDGTVRTLDISAQPIWDEENNKLAGINGGVRDVTERELAKHAIIDLNAKLTRKANQLTTINEIARDISAITDLTSALKRIKEKLETMLPLDAFYVALYDKDENIISFPIMYDNGKYWDQEPDSVTGTGGVGKVLLTGETRLINRTVEEIARINNAPRDDVLGDKNEASASILLSPLIVGEDIIGVISVQSYTPNSYDETHVDLLLGAGYQIAIAVENARLYDSLKESEERFRLISSVTSDYSFSRRVNDKGEWEHAMLSGAFESITGYTQKEYDEMGGWWALLHPDDREQDERDMAQLHDNQRIESQVRIIRQDGTVRKLDVSAQPIWDEDKNQLIGINGGVRDVTEREIAKQAIIDLNAMLTRKANHLAAIIEIARDISTLTDLSSTLKRILTKIEAILPLDAFYVALYDAEKNHIEFPIMYDSGKFWEQENVLINPETSVGKVLKTGIPVLINRSAEELTELEATKKRALGDEDKVSASILVTPLIINNNIIGVISIQSYALDSYDETHIDLLMGAGYQIAIAVENARLYDSLNSELSERKRLEVELQRHATNLETVVGERTTELSHAKEQLELILNSTTDALAFAHPNGDLIMANPAFFEMFDERAKESIENIIQLIPEHDEAKAISIALFNVIHKHRKQTLEAKVSKDEQEIDILLTLIPMPVTDDEARSGVLLSAHDITQFKEIDRFKARFVADAVHDLATPITGLSSRVYLLKRNPQKLDEHVSALDNQIEHLRSLLQDLRTLSLMDRGQIVLDMTKSNLNDLIQRVFDTYEPVAINKQQSLILETEPTLPEIQIDKQQISRVLVNLVSNAINYTPTQKEININTAVEEQSVIIRVSDQGMGIAAKDLPHIFDRFYRTDEARENLTSGSGLGLAITKEIINLHGGTITATSEINEGSTFTVMLPLSAD